MLAVFRSRDPDVHASVFELAVSNPDQSEVSHVASRFIAVDILEDFERVIENARVFCGERNAAYSVSAGEIHGSNCRYR